MTDLIKDNEHLYKSNAKLKEKLKIACDALAHYTAHADCEIAEQALEKINWDKIK